MTHVNKDALDAEYKRISKEFHDLVCSAHGCEYCDNDTRCTNLIRKSYKLIKMMEDGHADV